MNKKIMIFAAASVLSAVCFAKPSAENAYDFEYHVTFDEIKDSFNNKGLKKDIPLNWNTLADENEKKDEAAKSAGASDADAAKSIEQKTDPETLRPLAEAGNAFYQFQLGRCYARGEGIEQDYKQAVYWYSLAAEQGNHKAQNNLAVIYLYGIADDDEVIIEQDFNKALTWFEKSAANGDSYAWLNLGDMYRNALGVEQNYKKTMDCYKKAEKLGSKEAIDYIGHMYQNGFGVTQSDKQAFKYFMKAAEQGYAPSQYAVGVSYRDGRGVKQNAAEAEKWFAKAKKNGFELPQGE